MSTPRTWKRSITGDISDLASQLVNTIGTRVQRLSSGASFMRAALQFYADGGEDGGKRAKQALDMAHDEDGE